MERAKSFCTIAVFAFTALLLSTGSARAVSDEARRHMDRGQAAIEMAKTPADLDDAVKEFQKAIELAPSWPDPYYNLGMVQNKMERYDDALKNLKSYLQLAPNAKDVQEVKQLINKIEYKKDKESKVKRVFELLGSEEIDCKLISKENKGANSERNWGSPFAAFYRKDGVLGFANMYYGTNYQDDTACKLLYSGYMKGRPEWRPWVPVRINGRFFEFNYSYVLPGFNGREGGAFVTEVSGKGEIIALDPIRTKILFTEKVSLFVTDTGVYRKQNEVYTSEIVEECSEK